jgi:hypothetical protein
MERTSRNRLLLGQFPHGWVIYHVNLYFDLCLTCNRMFFLPESPRWLLANDKNEECLAALRFIAGAKNRDKKGFIESEYQDIEVLVREAAAAGKASFFSSFDPKGKALYRTLLGFMLMVCQQLTGANYFFYYGMPNLDINMMKQFK